MAAATTARAASPGGILAGTLILLHASVCTAQHNAVPRTAEPPSTATDLGTGSTAPHPEQRLLLDRVVATVNKKAILFSQLQPEFQARVAGAENALPHIRMLSDEERAAIMHRVLKERLDKAIRTEWAKTLGDHSPDEIEAWLERRRKAEQEERIKKYGSLNKLYTELNKFGTSAWALEEEDRTRLLKQLAWQDLLRHIGDQQSLLVTPREMHKLWKKVRPKRMRRPGTVVSMVTLGPGVGWEAPELAKKLAAEWAKSDVDASEIAGKYAGTALPDKRVTAADDEQAATWIKKFAAGAKLGEVSAPILRRDGSLWVLKAVQLDPGDDYSFSDPTVQRQLQRQIRNRKLQELGQRQLRRGKHQVRLWGVQSFHPWELR